MREKNIEQELKGKDLTNFSRWIGIFLVSFGVLFLIIAAGIYFYTASFVDKAIETRGVVVRLIRSQDGYKPLVIFTTQQGQEVEYVPNFSSNPPAYRVGEEVVVFYDPQNPYHAMLGGRLLYLIPIIFAVVGSIFAIIGIVILMVVRRRWRNQNPSPSSRPSLTTMSTTRRGKNSQQKTRPPTIRR